MNSKLQQARELLEQAKQAEGNYWFLSALLLWADEVQEYLEENAKSTSGTGQGTSEPGSDQ